MEIIGFTASRELSYKQKMFIFKIISKLKAQKFITGGCWGGDEAIAMAINKYHPNIPHTVIVPYNRSQVSQKAIQCASPKDNIIWMPEQTSYRDRNKKIVELSDKIIAFWNGNMRSGTKMTINIAKKANKLNNKDVYLFGDK